jgi:hypothetical protein
MKKLSKTAQKRKDQKINVILKNKAIQKFKEQDRKKEDEKDHIKHIDKDFNLKDFNSKEITEALKTSGIDVKNDTFADMERMLSNNESIKELVDIKNIRMKTNVTDEQHKIIVILYGAYKALLMQFNIDFRGLREILDQFIEIAPSINGKRAEQYVEAHQAIAQQNMANKNMQSGNLREPSEMKS